ncbi:hypothetical protein [Lysinibacillus sp. fls2-241-R2A-57]|uniref:hypothetical protein n=1 Tax=Lysinibacillus sp. fls2-241-R2A-57 TaxID=3040292 RepID=UPI002557BDDC|nr:hypothetical protein [Lysinibacillus sp. fls2-241-R2A-57]
MDKVQVTQEIDDAVKACDGLHKAFLIREIGNVFYGTFASNIHSGKLADLLKAQYTLEEAAQICFGEYVIVKSPEELIADLYNAKVSDFWTVHQEGVRQGIRYVASAFNLKIKGVNA